MKRVYKRIALAVLVVGMVICVGAMLFLKDLIRVHGDTPDLNAPTPEVKLAEWQQLCETTLRVGTSLREVDAFVQSLHFYTKNDEEPWDGRSYYHYFRKKNWVQYQLNDKDVRNRSLGDIDIQTTVTLYDDVVSSCQPIVFKHGR